MKNMLKITTILSSIVIVVCTALLITQNKTSYALNGECTIAIDQNGTPISGLKWKYKSFTGEVLEDGTTGADGLIPKNFLFLSFDSTDEYIRDSYYDSPGQEQSCATVFFWKAGDFRITKKDQNNNVVENAEFSIIDKSVHISSYGKPNFSTCEKTNEMCKENSVIIDTTTKTDNANFKSMYFFIRFNNTSVEELKDKNYTIDDIDIFMLNPSKAYNRDYVNSDSKEYRYIVGALTQEEAQLSDIQVNQIWDNVIKIDKDNIDLIDNVDENGYIISASGIKSYIIKNVNLDSYTTNANGEILLNHYNYYKDILIKEVKVPDGYTAEQTEYTTNISDGSITIVNNKIEEPTPEEPTPETPTPEEPTPEDKTQDKKTETTGNKETKNKEKQKTTDVKTKQVSDNKEETVQTGVSTNIEKYILAVGIVMFILSILVNINIRLKKATK